ncbi:hypothetical protein MTR_4g013380 [Medicago truncatula]|uniref:Uncharacterized protein n=1 Tax=Medicago truncatula TaxID=3880 RepID=A0A072USK0_MEDTR|nr:hypothetical protein MTR_4g013380 [Medicago truncatula]
MYPKPKKRKVKRLPMRSLAYWGIISRQSYKNHEDSSEDGNHLQRLAQGRASRGGRSPNNRSSAEIQA